jgi:D-arabinose 1-dehydrogenase-like Zn-dependent alcohol dehydrogenase
MKGTYQAMEVSEPGVLGAVERPIPEPGPGHVRIRAEACGMCHMDASTITGIYPSLTLRRVPGHEVVGRIEARGASVEMEWSEGRYRILRRCRRGDIVQCQNLVILGVTTDGVPGNPIQINAFLLVFGGRSIYRSVAGTAFDAEDVCPCLQLLENIGPMIETVPLEQAADVYDRMMQRKARFRLVLLTKDAVAESQWPTA